SVASGFGSGSNTSDSTPILSGRGEPGARIELIGTPFQTTVDANGRFTLTVDVVPGLNTLNVRESDDAGNETTVPFSLSFHDQSPREVSMKLTNDSGRSNQDFRTNDPRLTVLVVDDSPATQLTASINGR